MGYTKESAAPVAAGRDAQYLNAQTKFTASEDSLTAFKNAIRDAGLTPPEVIELGRLHRFPGYGKRSGNTAGWCKLFPDGRAGIFGDWSTDLSEVWRRHSNAVISPAERAELDVQIAAAKATRDRETHERQRSAAARARRLWRSAKPADAEHGYLIAKRIQPHKSRQCNMQLVLPLYDFDRHLHSLQFIGPDGDKKLLKGGKKSGCFISVAGTAPTARVLICEGWATGATLAENEPEALVLAAVDAGNLKAVATGARNKWPDAEIVIGADADPIGREKGRAAAIAAGALLAIPEFPPGAEGSDYNDLALLRAGGAQ